MSEFVKPHVVSFCSLNQAYSLHTSPLRLGVTLPHPNPAPSFSLNDFVSSSLLFNFSQRHSVTTLKYSRPISSPALSLGEVSWNLSLPVGAGFGVSASAHWSAAQREACLSCSLRIPGAQSKLHPCVSDFNTRPPGLRGSVVEH